MRTPKHARVGLSPKRLSISSTSVKYSREGAREPNWTKRENEIRRNTSIESADVWAYVGDYCLFIGQSDLINNNLDTNQLSWARKKNYNNELQSAQPQISLSIHTDWPESSPATYGIPRSQRSNRTNREDLENTLRMHDIFWVVIIAHSFLRLCCALAYSFYCLHKYYFTVDKIGSFNSCLRQSCIARGAVKLRCEL